MMVRCVADHAIQGAEPTVFRYCLRARHKESARSPGEKTATV